MNLEDIMLSEVSQSQKDKYSMIPLNEGSGIVKFIETEGRMEEASGWEEEETGGCCIMGTELQFCKMKKNLQIDGRDGRTTM